MTEKIDSKFGEIIVSRRHNASRITLKIATDGNLKITAPKTTPKFILRRFLEKSELEIEKMLTKHRTQKNYQPGMVIGKTHLLKLEYDAHLSLPQVKIRPNFLVVRLPFGVQIGDENVQSLIRPAVAKILRKEAKEILLPRLEFLAKQHGFVYKKSKLSHASTRWGSCSRDGVISLNIGLVVLSSDLIDYVIIHELCHLRQMNHSPKFWAEVANILPDYHQKEKALKSFSPHI